MRDIFIINKQYKLDKTIFAENFPKYVQLNALSAELIPYQNNLVYGILYVYSNILFCRLHSS